jgi:hypothetical protein
MTTVTPSAPGEEGPQDNQGQPGITLEDAKSIGNVALAERYVEPE